MRAALAAVLLLAACGKEAPVPPPPPPPAAAPPPAPRPGLIAFVRDGDLWTMNPDGSGARALTRIGRVADPAWSPDRSRLAFIAEVEPEANLYPRNVFTVGADGTGLAQVTPAARAGGSMEDAPKGLVTGRVALMAHGIKEPVVGARVTAYGTRRTATSGIDGGFQLYVPPGGGWIKAVAELDGKRHVGWKLAAGREGVSSAVGDLLLTPGEEDVFESPSWAGREILYRARHAGRTGGGVSLRRIRPDGTGDETILTPRTGIAAGPAARGGVAWIKTSEGRIERLDLDTKRVSDSIQAGVSVPDLLAAGPDGASFATLRFDASIRPALVLLRGGRAEELASFPEGEAVPHSADFSPDGARLVVDRRTPDGTSDLWILEIAGRKWSRLTRDGRSSSPVWHGR